MEPFATHWLALREAADYRARSKRLTRAIAARFADAAELSVLDLGSGTGANFRFLFEHLPHRQRWELVDYDSALLEAASGAIRSWAAARAYETKAIRDGLVLRGDERTCTVMMRTLDVAADGALEELCANRDLVTASALLDLVSEGWVKRLVEQCRRARANMAIALTYNGVATFSPSDPDDEPIAALVNRHQRSNKGFGAALGPQATTCLKTCLSRAGYFVDADRSDWQLGPSESSLQRQLVAGWANAAREMAPDESGSISNWEARRLTSIDEESSHVTVGHDDVVGWPPTIE